MTDIVERLRKASVYEEYKAILSNLGDEAADEIERLRALSMNNAHAWDALVRELDKASDEIERLRELEAILKELLEGLREGEGLRERYERRYALLDRGRRALGGTP